ncbi:DHH family phosphoesterase, partial [bacterium]|nr:DHH family phosphoesterase [bacterium]
MSKKWLWPPALTTDKVEKLSSQLRILPLTASIIIRRGLDEISAPGFLYPAKTRFKDFKDLPGTVDAGRLLAEAIRREELIVIFGDYDVDGITAAALLAEFINLRHGRYEIRLPNRMTDGYGLNQKAVQSAVAMGAGLLVTVDCGITAIPEIELARNSGLKVLLTDHHQPAETLPAADVIVNPQVTGPEEFQVLAGVGVAFQVVRA